MMATDGFTNQSFNVCSGYQVVTLDTLCEDSPGQIYLAGDFFGVTTPVISGDKATLEGNQQAQHSMVCSMRCADCKCRQ